MDLDEGLQMLKSTSDRCKIPEYRPETWHQLVEVLFADAFDAHLDRHRSPFVFRGTTMDWPLTPSLHRMGHGKDLIFKIEKALIRNFRKYARDGLDGAASEWKWLAIAQHHGLPTRLLDWTFSPFVALHFATDRMDHMGADGVIWMVDFIKSRRFLPAPLKEDLHKDFAWGFTVDMLESRFHRISALEEMKGDAHEFVLFFEPPSLDQRIVNQFGLFSLLNRPHADMNAWLATREREALGLARRVIVPAKLKWEARDKLDQMNLTERVIYPGLDGLSQWLKRWYSAKNGFVGT